MKGGGEGEHLHLFSLEEKEGSRHKIPDLDEGGWASWSNAEEETMRNEIQP